MEGTKIRWAGSTWNPFSGCSRVSPGCDHCYAETIALRFAGGNAYPNGFTPTYKPQKLPEPAKFLRRLGPQRVFVNSMSDCFHEDFTDEQIDSVFDVMLAVPEHDYLLLTKRPQRLAKYTNAWLKRVGLDSVPAHIWLGATIESDRYTFRANHLRKVDVPVRFLSLEPLLGPLPSLDLTGISWVIVGGESGKGYRPMDHDWARDLRARCADAGVAFYFKQSAAPRTEMGIELDGRLYEEYPLEHPALALLGARTVGVHTDEETP